MNPREAFNYFLGGVFGEEALFLHEGHHAHNDITLKVHHSLRRGRSSFFVKNLEQRLLRLREKFRERPRDFGNILLKTRNLAQSRWEGWYSELVAYDFLSLVSAVTTEIVVPSRLTMASFIPSRTESSFDGELPLLENVCF